MHLRPVETVAVPSWRPVLDGEPHEMFLFIMHNVLGENMKKCLISTLVILSGLYVSPCNAVVSLQTCPGTSITVGTKCNTLTGGLQSFLMDTSCQDPLTGGIKDSCLVYLCDGTCVCRTTPCTQIIDPDPILSCEESCFTNVWIRQILLLTWGGFLG